MTTETHNLPIETIVDELGAVKAEKAEIERRERVLKDELIARGVETAEGKLYRVAVSAGTRWSLDKDAVTAELGEAWVQKHSKMSTFTTVRVSARTGKEKVA